jgi:hypothetical protein
MLAFLAPGEIEAQLSGGRVERNEFSVHLTGPRLLDSFGVSLSHLDAFGALDREIRSQSEEDPEDGLIFRTRIRQLTRWRLNLRSQTVSSFYPIIGDLFFGERIDGLNLSIDLFRGSLQNLLNEWGVTHEQFSTA